MPDESFAEAALFAERYHCDATCVVPGLAPESLHRELNRLEIDGTIERDRSLGAVR